MIVVDASVWISSLIEQDINHPISLQWFEAYTDGGGVLVEPVFFLVEVAGAVARLRGSPADGKLAASRLSAISGLRLVGQDAQFSEAAADLAADLRLRGADAIYVATAHLLGIPLLTWDREQRERAGAVVRVHTPA
ncbi:MAG TPA: PIN domain-containing protein [Chloroflexota bacterium]|nr:PIN domain-containing protein [Chloroflexota bacterium]